MIAISGRADMDVLEGFPSDCRTKIDNPMMFEFVKTSYQPLLPFGTLMFVICMQGSWHRCILLPFGILIIVICRRLGINALEGLPCTWITSREFVRFGSWKHAAPIFSCFLDLTA